MVDHRLRGRDDAGGEPRRDWIGTLYAESKPLVSLIFPALDPEVLERACDGLFYDTDWPEDRLDLIVTDQGLSRTAPDLWNRLNRHPRVRMISVGSPDDISATFSQGVRVCGGDVVVLMDRVEPAAPDWLSALAGMAMRREVGAVFANVVGPLAQPILECASADDKGYLGQFILNAAPSAVTGGCIALRREVLEEVRCLDKTPTPGLNDADLCLALQDLGYRIAWCPQALLKRTVGP